jgi:hypothetical protein
MLPIGNEYNKALEAMRLLVPDRTKQPSARLSVRGYACYKEPNEN